MKTKIEINHESIEELISVLSDLIKEYQGPLVDNITVDNLPMTLQIDDNSYFAETTES